MRERTIIITKRENVESQWLRATPAYFGPLHYSHQRECCYYFFFFSTTTFYLYYLCGGLLSLLLLYPLFSHPWATGGAVQKTRANKGGEKRSPRRRRRRDIVRRRLDWKVARALRTGRNDFASQQLTFKSPRPPPTISTTKSMAPTITFTPPV